MGIFDEGVIHEPRKWNRVWKSQPQSSKFGYPCQKVQVIIELVIVYSRLYMKFTYI